MSFIDCINRAVKDGAVTVDRGEAARQAYKSAYAKEIQDGANPFDAELKAARKATNRLTDQNAQKRAQKMMSMIAMNDIMTRWESSPDGMDGVSKLYGTLDGDIRWTGTSFDSRYKMRQGQYHEAILQFIDKYRPKYAGIYSTKAGLDNFIRELANTNSGDKAAKEFADAVKQGMEIIVENANKAGASIHTNPRWWFPQKHSRVKMRNQKLNWVDDHIKNLDWNETKWADGSDILSEDRARFLHEAFDSIDTRGAKKELKSFDSKNENLADKMSKGRVLYYKDADAWLSMNEKYGDGNPFETLVDWIDSMARNTAMLETYGANPNVTIDYLKRLTLKEAAEKQSVMQVDGTMSGKSPLAKVEDRLGNFEDTWELANLGNKASDENKFASVMSTTRNITRASLLSGSVAINVAGDTMNAVRIARLNKVSAVKYIRNYTKLAFSSYTRKEAVRAGLIADSATNRMIAATRWGFVEQGARWSKYISDVTMRLALTTPHTQIAKWAQGMMYMGEFADNVGKSFDSLPFKAVLERHGISSNDWDVIRKVAIHEPSKVNILRPNDLRKSGIVSDVEADLIADKFMAVVFAESRRAIIEANYRARSFLGNNVQAGTVKGETLRVAGEFMSFPVTITMALSQETMLKKTKLGKFGILAGFFTTMTIAGAMGVQFSNLASGKDPQDMYDWKFWGEAMLKGGSFGIFGDFLFAEFNDYGQSAADIIAGGPSGDFWFDIGKMSVGNLTKLARGEDTELASQASKFVGKYFPASKIPIVKAAFERALIDQLLLMSDPKAAKKFNQSEQKLMKDKKQKRWWKKGDALPNRSPDFSAVIQN